MVHVMHERIPRDRVGVLIGSSGRVKERLEKLCSVKITVDGSTGDVEISMEGNESDVSKLLLARNVVKAIGRGFSPEKAFRLLEDDVLFECLDLRRDFGMTPNDVKRIQGRIIGRDGKMRRNIEELTEVHLSCYGTTVSIIGRSPGFEVAREAIRMLIEGRQHSTVYRFLSRERKRIRRAELSLWEEKPPLKPGQGEA
ncbi:RNA-processing protein [Candidatus Bathyarchaeota archaeon]|nr:RNA-processing protein [Candidatus Bathyarchaeota archaeon]MBS7627617.1 RNA-processing protein [Candidatus Bathyarchaeota archaeon]